MASQSGTGGFNLPSHLDPVLPLEKLLGYVLNSNATATGGANKARLFKSLLGIGAEDAESVREQLLDGVFEGRITGARSSVWGQRYQIEIEIRGNNNKTASVDTVWQVEPDGTLKFVTVRTIKKDR